ncbi:hypothetical protein [Lactococcus lactis]|uniref:Uncharacterized protein n=1 Tax=Lactococcus lactis TaxID=1358 RepID=A0AAP3Z2K9_9LACT|nr:hypothetical protein [Lactococcus lactis]MDG4969253.1 hypothetical protein [Lactococcus lactis]MDG4977184.1 hypothetical protein [Lactococcus lactis]MDG5103347.1 hypothetical protein [Lactococcus lactis]TNU78249.1 hypothetical protein FIB48_09440 [Lactococcus lactis subsp. lactis]
MVVYFDNGTTIEFPDYATTATVYGIGYPKDFDSTDPTQWPLPVMIIRLSLGHVTLAQMTKAKDLASYWAQSTHVGNPVNNSSKYDFSKTVYNPNDNGLSLTRQPYMIKALYELGIFKAATIESLGAIAL